MNALEWLKHEWRKIKVRDALYFRFIWIVAISVTLITVLISAGVTAKSGKAKAKEEEEATTEEPTTVQEITTEAPKPVTPPPNASVTDADAWYLILVNDKHPLPENYSVTNLTELASGSTVDSRIVSDLDSMFADAELEGYYPHITKGFVDGTAPAFEREQLINELLDSGKTKEQAEAEADKQMNSVGKNEHETGLAIDIGNDEGGDPDSDTWKWIKENSYKYGFIVRYPEDKSSVTGVSDDKYHLRYVGIEDAKAIKKSGQCLEEYLGQY